MDLLDEKRSLGALDRRTREQETRMQELNTLVGKIDFTATIRGPLYSDFVRAMAELEGEAPLIGAAVLSAEALAKRRQHALAALRKAKRKS